MEIKPVNPKRNQPWIFIGKIDAEAEAPIFWPPDVKSWLLEKALMLGKTEGKRRRVWQRMRWLDGIPDSKYMILSKLWMMVKDRENWRAVVHGVAKSLTWLRDWTMNMKVKWTCYSLSHVRLCNCMDCSQPGSSVHGILQTRITGVCCHFLLQGIFQTQRLNLGFLHSRQILYYLSLQGSPWLV